MKNKYSFLFALILLIAYFISCSSNEEVYIPIPTSPVVVDLSQVPYPKLSDYNFFEGELKYLNPSLDVLPYEPASSLFSDFAHKKRFIWMPKESKATYNGDGNVLELPIGSAIIKSFYYENVQNSTPIGSTVLVETRIMIRKNEGWIFANYVWNEEQTEAYFDLLGSYKTISWLDENNVLKTAEYRIPNEVQCITCHKSEKYENNILITTNIPIGIKPQNLNFNYEYSDGNKNQLEKWIEKEYLENNFSLPSAQNTTINYNDTSKPIDLRARSYFDVNCAHCHNDEGHCSYRPMRFPFNETYNNNTNMGVCVDTQDMQDFPNSLGKIVAPGNINKSMLYYRLNTTDESYRMPLHGRTLIHEEGLQIIEEWINTLQPCQ
ncbi:hypothetical protein [uncultured Flavobacterium sp.]|uniref:hypothetical protein n=1 Tax=uncultured Flavobacterium sp. TaxID=165435 RepID=UPI0030CA41E2|tara:strand:- start:3105 stop:4238 length:1134 start_codon:yes stop_codon:yes gene_type:complete